MFCPAYLLLVAGRCVSYRVPVCGWCRNNLGKFKTMTASQTDSQKEASAPNVMAKLQMK